MFRILCRSLASVARLAVRSGRSKDLEIIVLRHQLGLLNRQLDRPQLADDDRTLRGAIGQALPRCLRTGFAGELAAFLKTISIHPLDDGRPVGQLLAQTQTADVVDAHLVITALRLGDDILTGDPDDLATLSAALGPATPAVHAWP